ncbi:SIS domain-containing protein [Halorubrum trapanicum]|uniref:KpsF/GutQ family sugar-phosphate isomerase n=1 Tax=Halorubrum trapanicum TaxID=29284 RepID=UPI000BBA7050|nr:KpsF/GutQ family sugar-phosphate isomerase [Halorubrum trapanicum]
MSRDRADSTGDDTITTIERTIELQAACVADLLNEETVDQIKRVAEMIDASDGRIVFTGVGKSGDVAKKIVSTFNSIGVSSHFIHPVEALHGDIGVLAEDDIVIFVSNSGNTNEIVELQKFIEPFDPMTITITSSPDSKLGRSADRIVDTRISEEGSVVDLVPMASTTTTIVIGDCIANALMERKGFTKDDFGQFHPSGTIGKRLLLDASDLLYGDIPRTHPDDTLAEVALKMSKGGKGIAVVQNQHGQVLGILTDGDIRRLLQDDTDLHDVVAEEVMITDPVTITPDVSAVEALELLEENNITQLVVADSDNTFEGIIHLHDIMEEGLTSTRNP